MTASRPASRIPRRELSHRTVPGDRRRTLDPVDRARRLLRGTAIQRLPRSPGHPQAVLAERLAFLTEQRVLTKEAANFTYRQGQAALAADLVDDQLGQRELSREGQQTDLPARGVRRARRARSRVPAVPAGARRRRSRCASTAPSARSRPRRSRQPRSATPASDAGAGLKWLVSVRTVIHATRREIEEIKVVSPRY